MGWLVILLLYSGMISGIMTATRQHQRLRAYEQQLDEWEAWIEEHGRWLG
jgi:hypothetical protein